MTAEQAVIYCIRKTVPLLLLLPFSFLTACSDGSGWFSIRFTVGDSYDQCDRHNSGYSDTSDEIIRAINTHIPPGAEVRCTDKREFSYDGRTVTFTYIAYGRLNDCFSGCYSSNLCGFDDNGGSLLYSAAWYNSEEPLSISQECPELSNVSTANTLTDCSPQPQGYLHPVTGTQDFLTFQDTEGNRSFRFCFQ